VSLDDLKGDELRGVRVLVVEDEPETLELVCLTLRTAGATVTEAANAEDALARLEAETPDVVVSDLQMPGLDGFDLVRRMRERAHPPKCIALSASMGVDEARRALEAGFAVHVAKPIAMLDLVDTIRAAL
jgi:CheY-like chemotaxis protein